MPLFPRDAAQSRPDTKLGGARLLRKVGLLAAAAWALCALPVRAETKIGVDFSQVDGTWQMTRYSLGQGGLQSDPMIEPHVRELKVLRPRFIRLFVDEYYRMYPRRGRPDFSRVDRELRAIQATGARPIMSLVMKPPLLFPTVDHDVVHPNDYNQWRQLVAALVRHCQRMKFDVAMWEVGNEPDIGETGGTPYRFRDGKDYATYYTHTVEAIRSVDPHAKVGGPAVASADSELIDALIEHCAKNDVPLDFISWHLYSDKPEQHAEYVAKQRAKLARFPKLNAVQTLISEWNMNLMNPNLHPAFQPAFVLETTRRFAEAGLDYATYYHIRDCFVDDADFDWMSPKGLDFMAHWWNTMPQYSALFDHHGRVRPAWYAFRLLRGFEGARIKVNGEQGEIRAIAVDNPPRQHLLVWRFGDQGPATAVTVQLSGARGRQIRVVALDAAAPLNNLKVVRLLSRDRAEKEGISLQMAPWDIRWIEIE